MKYFYSSKDDLLKNSCLNHEQHTIILNCKNITEQKSFAGIMSSSLGGEYPESDILEDSQQSGSSLERFLVLKTIDDDIACSRYLKFVNTAGVHYIILCDLGVRQEFQGQGYGQKMFRERLRYIVQNEEFSYVFSEIQDDNFPSIAIPKKFGLKEVSDPGFLRQFPEVL